ncbi:MAG: leucine-rich repeat protein, partial [Prevotellaceae bacterium]|nr:leucine-rich repeat protein [Prevotellaceae bacterium]
MIFTPHYYMKATAHYFFTLLCGLLVLAGATSVQAAGGTTGSCTWDLTGSTLTISGTGAMANYSTTTTAPWYSSRASIKAIAIQNGVTTIGEAAFYDCIGVTSVSIPSSVTTIGGYAFAVCSSLTSVSIPSSVTSIGNGVFQRCISLTSVTIPSSVTTIADYAFFDCGGLTSVTIPSSVTSIGNSVFCYCSSLTSITIPSSVTSIGSSAFSFCSGLTSVTIPSSVTSIGTYTFSICSSLTSVTISSSVTSIGNSAFSDCSSLTSVTIPSSVTSIGNGVFQRCSNLTSITIPSSVTSIGDKAFESCTKLTSVTCVGTTPPTAATAGGGAFPQSNLYVPASALAAYQQATWWKDFKSITGIGNGSSSFLLDVTLSSVKAGVIDATSAQSGMYASGASVTLRATGKAGYSSFAWKNASGTTVSTANPYKFSLTANTTLIATWTPVTYSITYSNTKSVAHSNPSTYTVESAKITLANLSAAGYTFNGWYDAATGGSKVTEIATGSTGNLTLYAQWTTNTYSITYSCADLKGNTAPAGQSYTVETPTFTLPVLSAADHTFGWYDDATGGSKVEQVAQGSTGSYTLYGRWMPVEYIITYSNLKGSATPTPASYTVETNTFSLPVISATGYSFSGWYDAETGGTRVTQVPKGSTGNVERWARWAVNTYTVVYHGNGATGDTTAGSAHTYDAASCLTPNGFVRTGYSFEGWATTPTGAKEHDENASVLNLTAAPNGVVTLYAQWSPNTYTVVYHGNGATGDTTAGTQHTYDAPSPLAVSGFKRTGYAFAAWNTQPDGSGDRYAAGADVTTLTAVATGVVTLYAQWSPNTYTVVYHGNGATSDTTANSAHTYNASSRLTPNGFVRVGYAFDGWATTPTGAKEHGDTSSVFNLTAAPNGVVTLYAKWKPNRYTVAYHGNSATSDTTADTQHIYGVPSPLAASSFKRTGYTFAAWNTQPDGLGDSYAAGANVTTLTAVANGVVTLYAQWSPNAYTVAYHGNGATGDTTAGTQHTYGEEKPLVANGFTKTGYTFTGWNIQRNGG